MLDYNLKTIAVSLLIIGAMVNAAHAGDQALNFRLVTHTEDMHVLESPHAEGHVLGSGVCRGTAVFGDGAIASKFCVFIFDEGKEGGTASGYSVYTFADGSAITARLEDVTGADGSARGEYTVLSGTGRYEGATGSGWYEKAEEPWEAASLWNGGFDLTLP